MVSIMKWMERFKQHYHAAQEVEKDLIRTSISFGVPRAEVDMVAKWVRDKRVRSRGVIDVGQTVKKIYIRQHQYMISIEDAAEKELSTL